MKDIYTLIEGLKMHRATITAYSMNPAVAMEFLKQPPEKIKWIT